MISDFSQRFTRTLRFSLGLLHCLVATAAWSANPSANEERGVAFSPPGGAYTTNVILRLTAQDSSAVLRYTLDGSLPSDNSLVYSAPVRLTNTVLVRVRAFSTNPAPGKTAAQAYTLLEEDLATFTSNLPLIIVNSFGANLTHDQKTEGALQFFENGQSRAGFAQPATLSVRTLLNIRGRASLRYPKNSYSVKTLDGDGDPSAVSPFGFPSDTDWVLYAPYPDKTFLRDVLAYEWHTAMGHWAPRTKLVEVFIDRTGAKLSRRDYAGVYVFEERVKRGKERVNMAKLKPDDGAEPAITGGYIFKKDHTDQGAGPIGGEGFGGGQTSQSTRAGFPTGPGGFPADPKGFAPAARTTRSTSSGSSSRNRVTPVYTNHLGFAWTRQPAMNRDSAYREEADSVKDEEYFRTARTNQFYFVEPDADEITAVQKSWLKHHLNQVEAALYGEDFRDPTRGYRAFLDTDSFIDYHLLTEITKNVDGYRFSVFYHKDRGGKIRADPIWDWNLSLGNANGKQGWLPEFWLWPQLDDKECTWYRRLFEDPEFGQRYVDRFAQLRTNVFATKRLLARVDELASLLQEAQKRNYEKWPILGRTINPNWYTFSTYEEEVGWLKKFAESRLRWMERQFPPVPTQPVSRGGDRLAWRAATGEIYFTLDGTDPRASGGGVSKTARLYQSEIRPPPGAKLFARTRDGQRWSAPLVSSLGEK